jgi:predicted transposase YbfD/YdcC
MSEHLPTVDLVKYFSEIRDPRVDRQKLHALSDILLIVFCGVICGVETWQDFVDFGVSKIEYLRKFTPLTNGIPSKNTFNRVISSLDPPEIKDCFIRWTSDFEQELGSVVAIDGKTLRRSFDKANEHSAIHMVSAYASESRLVLAQQKITEKSNEITAIPKLLDMLHLPGSIVTIDAMGCQKNIASKIVAGGGDYVLAVKGNQGSLHNQIIQHFNPIIDGNANDIFNLSTTEGKSRGRLESRACYSTSELGWLSVAGDWAGIKSCCALVSTRTIGECTTTEIRYYISTLAGDAKQLNAVIRAHWAIENSLHWILDVVFGEDYSRIRAGHAAENMAMIKHVALNKLQAAKPKFHKSMSIKRLRKKAGWDDDTLDTILLTKI